MHINFKMVKLYVGDVDLKTLQHLQTKGNSKNLFFEAFYEAAEEQHLQTIT